MAVTVPFERYHGTDNDFVVVDASDHVPDRAAFAREACDPRDGEGVDGVLFLALEDQYPTPRVIMTLVQPDGGTAAMCGNGVRCAAHWAARRTGADVVMVDTQAGTRRAEVAGDRVTVEMGRPAFDPAAVPLVGDEPLIETDLGGWSVTAVNTGVPHAVVFVDDVAAVDLQRGAPAIRNHEIFPEGANVTVAARTAPGEFDQRTYERGVEGETASCGTGAVAVAAAARRTGRLEPGRPAVVSPPGGDLEVAFGGAGVASLHGPVEFEYAGRFERVPEPRRIDASSR